MAGNPPMGGIGRPSGRILDVDDLYALGPGMLADLYAAHCWHAAPAEARGAAETIPGVSAVFLPSRRTAYVSVDVDSWLRRFCDGEFTRGRIAEEKGEEWSLGFVRTALSEVVAAFAMGIGPDDERLMQYEWDSVWSHPHGHGWSLGVHELAQAHVDEFVTKIGWQRIDPRLLLAKSMRRNHAVQAEAARAMLDGLAAVMGTTYEAELREVLRDGGGQLALWKLAGRIGRLADDTAFVALTRPPVLVSFRRALEEAVLDGHRYWSQPPYDLTDLTDDELVGREIGKAAVARVRDTVRRIRVGMKGLGDLSVLGDALVLAAEAATRGIADDMEVVFDTMDKLSNSDE